MGLADLFSEADYRFQPALARGSGADFFAPTPAHAAICAERVQWLNSEPKIYSACLAEGGLLLDECIHLATQWGSISPDERQSLTGIKATSDCCIRLGEFWEPDFLLLKPNDAGNFVLLGGCVCFPSMWRLDEKIGRPLHFIHEAVPELNAQLGRSITSVLRALKPDSAWLRHNWGLTRSAELNQHPSRKLPPLDAGVSLDEVWLRVEYQVLVALPRTGGILFGIRIAIHSLAEVKVDKTARQRLMHALRTMPENIATYKGIATARGRLIELLEA